MVGRHVLLSHRDLRLTTKIQTGFDAFVHPNLSSRLKRDVMVKVPLNAVHSRIGALTVS